LRALEENAMQTRPFIATATLIFIAVAVAHAWRLYRQWPLQLGPLAIPVDLSWLGLAISAALAAWGVALLRR
jgi:hypothetical protein